MMENTNLEKKIKNCERKATFKTLAGALLMSGSIVGGFWAYDNTPLDSKHLIPLTVSGISGGMYLWGSGYCRREEEYLHRFQDRMDYQRDLKESSHNEFDANKELYKNDRKDNY